MALRTFTLPSVFLADATTLVPVAKYEPPFRDPILDATGRMPDTWVSWFTRTSDRLADHETRIEGLEGRMTAVETRMTAAEAHIVTLQSQVATLQSEVASILSRLTAAGIP
jgi:uncharacterized coiled-coil protein SlyX